MAISEAMPIHKTTYDIIKILQDKGQNPPVFVKHEVSKKLKELERNAIKKSLAFMLNELYDWDKVSLERDIAKVALVVREEVHTNPSERLRLLRIYWWIIDTYFEGNAGLLVDMCKKEKRP